VQIIPSWYHTGTPRHFHSSTTSASACLMTFRIRASVSPRQSLSSLILSSISCEGELFPFAASEPRFVFVVADFFMADIARLHSFTGQSTRLLHPVGESGLVERVVLTDIEIAHFLLPGLTRRSRPQ